MNKTKARKILEETRGTKRSVVSDDELLKDDLSEGLGTSIQSFITAQNKIPQTYRQKEITLGSQILLWLWMRSRFDELEAKIMQEIRTIKTAKE